MTRKHFKAVAEALRREIESYPETKSAIREEVLKVEEGRRAVRSISHKLADIFMADNERFDRERFLTACGIRGEI